MRVSRSRGDSGGGSMYLVPCGRPRSMGPTNGEVGGRDRLSLSWPFGRRDSLTVLCDRVDLDASFDDSDDDDDEPGLMSFETIPWKLFNKPAISQNKHVGPPRWIEKEKLISEEKQDKEEERKDGF
jgi:hypothetical protein